MAEWCQRFPAARPGTIPGLSKGTAVDLSNKQMPTHYQRNREAILKKVKARYYKKKAEVLAAGIKWRKENHDRHLTNKRNWWRGNSIRVNFARRAKKYGISVEDLKALYERSGGRCEGCGRKETTGKHGILCVDHDHATGRVRGLLCNGCNVAVGCSKENPKTLRALASYLEAR